VRCVFVPVLIFSRLPFSLTRTKSNMTRFLVIDRTGLGRAALNAAQERESTAPQREPGSIATPYDAVIADTCLTDDAWERDAEHRSGSRVAEVQAPDFRKLAWRLAH
jgi:hypothetical protein